MNVSTKLIDAERMNGGGKQVSFREQLLVGNTRMHFSCLQKLDKGNGEEEGSSNLIMPEMLFFH